VCPGPLVFVDFDALPPPPSFPPGVLVLPTGPGRPSEGSSPATPRGPTSVHSLPIFFLRAGLSLISARQRSAPPKKTRNALPSRAPRAHGVRAFFSPFLGAELLFFPFPLFLQAISVFLGGVCAESIRNWKPRFLHCRKPHFYDWRNPHFLSTLNWRKPHFLAVPRFPAREPPFLGSRTAVAAARPTDAPSPKVPVGVFGESGRLGRTGLDCRLGGAGARASLSR
jgi:hypothetical protein